MFAKMVRCTPKAKTKSPAAIFSQPVTISRLDGIPYDQLDAIQSIRLIPTLLYDTEIRVVEDRPVTEHQPEVVLRTVPLGETDTFRGDSLEPGTRFIGVGDSVSYPEFAVSFAVK